MEDKQARLLLLMCKRDVLKLISNTIIEIDYIKEATENDLIKDKSILLKRISKTRNNTLEDIGKVLETFIAMAKVSIWSK